MIAPSTIGELTSAIRGKQASVSEMLDIYLSRISKYDSGIGAYLNVASQSAKSEAKQLQARISRGEWPGPLTGVPIAVKDNISVAGLPLTAGSRILESFVPIYTATAVSRLRAAGAIVIGKTNLDEFAMGSSNEYSAFSVVHNPYDSRYVPGGSSGGSAASLAAGLALGALGSDTGGSVRQPGAFCGLVALKPSYGAISRSGLIAFASSLDQIGPMAHTGLDCARLYAAMRGCDSQDATSRTDLPPVDIKALQHSKTNLIIGIDEAAVSTWCGSDMTGSFTDLLSRFTHLGASFKQINLPDSDTELATYHILADAEASSNLARYDGLQYGPRCSDARELEELCRRTRGELFGPEVKRRILLGTYVLSGGYYDAYYQRAVETRSRIQAAYEEIFDQVDLILTPTTGEAAFALGEKRDDPVAMYQSDRWTIAANLTGFPAITFPIGFSKLGLPLGAQLEGPIGSEETLLSWVHRFDENQPPPGPSLAEAPEGR